MKAGIQVCIFMDHGSEKAGQAVRTSMIKWSEVRMGEPMKLLVGVFGFWFCFGSNKQEKTAGTEVGEGTWRDHMWVLTIPGRRVEGLGEGSDWLRSHH